MSTFWATKACALPLQLASSFATTWHWHRDAPLSASIILSAFYPLTKIGPVRSQLIRIDMHKVFSELKWVEATGVQFETLSRGNILPLMHDLFDAGRLAMENFILFLSMLFNLRFKVQDALHRALMRSQAWLADCVNVMGIGSSPAQDFILYSHVLLAEDFHNVLCQASRFPRHSINLWLSEVEAIPMIGRYSLRDIQLTQVQNLAGHISEATLGHFKLTPGKVVTGDLPSGKPRKLKNDKTKAGNTQLFRATQMGLLACFPGIHFFTSS
jgi:hypothetical protein